MAAKKFKTYCKITDYIEAKDADLFNVIKGLCLEGALLSLKGKAGLTFLWPQDKKFRDKLFEMAYSENPDDIDKARDLILALIIRDSIKQYSEWARTSPDIGNALYPSQKIIVKSATAKEIIFDNDARAVPDPNFIDSSPRKCLSVWKLVSGHIPVTENRPATLVRSKKLSEERRGNYEVSNFETQTNRFKIALAVENDYMLYILSRNSMSQKRIDPYFQNTMSLVNFIINVKEDDELAYSRVLPLMSFCKLDFYFLIEPHKPKGPYLIPDSIILEWWSSRITTQFDISSIITKINQMLSNPKNCDSLIYKSRSQIYDKLAKIRLDITDKMDSRPRSCVDEIEKVYMFLDQTNKLKSPAESEDSAIGPIYPTALAEYYKTEPGLKMIQDELRFVMHGAFCRLESNSFDRGLYNEIINVIGECLHAASQTERSSTLKMLNKSAIKYLISPNDRIEEIKVFVNSTMFIFIPLTRDEIVYMRQKHSITRPKGQQISFYNVAKEQIVMQNRLLDEANPSSSSNLVAAIKSLDVDRLDPELRNELKAKFS